MEPCNDCLLACFLQKNKMNLLHIESRPHKTDSHQYEFLIECDTREGNAKGAFNALREFVTDLRILARSRTTSQSTSGNEGITTYTSLCTGL